MKKLLKRNHITIKFKLIALIGGQLLLFIIVLYAVFFVFQNILERNVSALTHQTLSTVTGNVEMNLNQQILLSNTIASDNSLIKLLRTNSSSIWVQVQLLEKMKSYMILNSNTSSIAIYNNESGRILSTTEGSVQATKKMIGWVKDLDQNAGTMGFYVDIEEDISEYIDTEPMITLLRKMPGKLKNYYLIVSTSKQMLNQVIGKVELWQGTEIIMTDSKGNGIFNSGNSLQLLEDKDVVHNHFSVQRAQGTNRKSDTQRNDFISIAQYSNLTNWNIEMIIPQKEIMKDVLKMKQNTTFIIFVIGLILFTLSIFLYTQILNPIKRLITSMVKVEKGFPHQPIKINRFDELGFLQKRFNDMIHNEQQMREQIMQEQLHSKEIELKFLQSQVNPHFLYNTLDSIYWVAIENDAEEIGDVVLDLSRYFRLSLSRGKEFVSVGEAIEHLEYYLRIQQFRHTDKFKVSWNIDSSLDDIQIMKLMLQPIVENSIVHGMERMAEFCQLYISIYKKRDWIIFRIEDTGIGMSRSALRKLLHEIKRQEGPSKATYGLRNLYQRLKLMYGDDMHFAMSSLPEQGTRVTISIHTSRLKGECKRMKVIIVEDEPRVRNGLSKAVDWSSLGMSLIGTASNGQEGLELFYSNLPELVIADIRMPVMDGLEMTRIILEHTPSTKVMIISGHDEFEYAQRCVSLGVSNYLLKPVGKKELHTELVDINKEWISNKHMKEQELHLQRTLRIHLQQLRCSFLEEWLGVNGYRTKEELYESLRALEININREHPVAVGIFEVDDQEQSTYSTSDRRLLEYALHKLLEELLDGRGIAYQRGNGQTVVLFQETKLIPLDTLYQEFYDWMNVSKDYAESMLRVQITAGIGSRTEFLNELPIIFQETQRVLGLKLSLGRGLILQESMIHPVSEQLAVLHESYEALLIHGVEMNDREEIKKVIEQHFIKWNESQDITFAEEIFFQFTGLFTKLVHRLGKSIRDYLDSEDYKKWQRPQLFRSMYEIKNWWIDRFCGLSDSYQGFRSDRKTKLIQQVMKYVEDHIDENISRDDAANYVYINSSYLSRLFREVTGESFSSYVLNKKMERAIHLLQVERVMVYEVAERLGYKDPSYFARVFKKHVGKSPSDFQ